MSWIATCGTCAVTVRLIDPVAERTCASVAVTAMVLVPVSVLELTVATNEKLPPPLSLNDCAPLPPIDDRSAETAIPVLSGCVPGETETESVVLSPADTLAGEADAEAMVRV